MRRYIPIFSQDDGGGGGEAIGTIVPRLNGNFKSANEAKKYLYCNGSSFDINTYPKLYKILGTNILPDIRNRYLQGNDTGWVYLEAGLPNITGGYGADNEQSESGYGAFFHYGDSFGFGAENNDIGRMVYFDASRCSPIYGRSNTVQPPSLTVRYYIRAKWKPILSQTSYYSRKELDERFKKLKYDATKTTTEGIIGIGITMVEGLYHGYIRVKRNNITYDIPINDNIELSYWLMKNGYNGYMDF